MDKKRIHITLFYCNNSIHHQDLSEINKNLDEVGLKIVGLPCSGKIDILYLLKSIETGTDGVMIVACLFGECQHLEGNFRAQKRVDAVNVILKESGMETDRIKLIQPKPKTNAQDLLQEIKNFIHTIQKLPKPGSVTV